MTSKQMLKTKLPPKHMVENIAPLGAKPNWRIVPVPELWGKIRATIDHCGRIVFFADA